MSAFLTIDASSLRGDAFAWLAGFVTPAEEFVIAEIGGWERDELRHTSLAAIADVLAARAAALGVREIFGDQREEAGLSSLFAERDTAFRSFAWTESSKDDAVMLLRRMMRERRLFLPDHEQLRRELSSLKARLLPSGRTRYETSGVDYASALITLAHAEVAGEVPRGGGMDWAREMVERFIDPRADRHAEAWMPRTNHGGPSRFFRTRGRGFG